MLKNPNIGLGFGIKMFIIEYSWQLKQKITTAIAAIDANSSYTDPALLGLEKTDQQSRHAIYLEQTQDMKNDDNKKEKKTQHEFSKKQSVKCVK